MKLAKSIHFCGHMQLDNYPQFYKANIISFFTAIIIIGFSVIVGKNNLFFLLNNDLGKQGDMFFEYATYLGDGVVWAIFAIAVIFLNWKKLPLVLIAIIISTLIAHYIKGHLLKINYRPVDELSDQLNMVHLVKGVTINYGGSFPSGHSTQVFTMYLLACLLWNKNWLLWVGLLYALLVGYSRVYLAQHFPIDVAGGIGVAIISSWIALWIQRAIEKKWQKKFI